MTRAWLGTGVGIEHSEISSVARGMTDVDVGSGALLGVLVIEVSLGRLLSPKDIRGRYSSQLFQPNHRGSHLSPLSANTKQTHHRKNTRSTWKSGRLHAESRKHAACGQ